MGIENLLEYVYTYSIEDKKTILSAYQFASFVHRGALRKSGEPYIIHPLNVACILAEMHADVDTIVAGLLHDTIEDGENVTKEDIARFFNPKVANLVDGVTKMKKMQFNNDIKRTDEANMRKIVESITFDIRIFIIKLADRLHNMRTLQYQKPAKQIEHSIETMELFVPFANMIGEYTFKTELEDLSFKYLKNKEYEEMKSLTENELKRNREEIDEMVSRIAKKLIEKQMNFNVKLRMRSLYSLYEKMMVYKDIEEIHDLFSLKLIVDTVDDCYQALDVVEELYEAIDSKYKDYIMVPKTNLYKALHTTVIASNNSKIQFQFFTPEMYSIAEYGLPAYWNLYTKRTLSPAKQMQDDVKTLPFFSVLENLSKADLTDKDFNKEVKKVILCKKIYVFSPEGDIVELPEGSTPLDYAKKVSPFFLNNAYGCYINGKKVPMDYQLKNKDMVVIMTNKFVDNYNDFLISIIEDDFPKVKRKRRTQKKF